jgi:hypothetical protein
MKQHFLFFLKLKLRPPLLKVTCHSFHHFWVFAGKGAVFVRIAGGVKETPPSRFRDEVVLKIAVKSSTAQRP